MPNTSFTTALSGAAPDLEACSIRPRRTHDGQRSVRSAAMAKSDEHGSRRIRLTAAENLAEVLDLC